MGWGWGCRNITLELQTVGTALAMWRLLPSSLSPAPRPSPHAAPALTATLSLSPQLSSSKVTAHLDVLSAFCLVSEAQRPLEDQGLTLPQLPTAAVTPSPLLLSSSWALGLPHPMHM